MGRATSIQWVGIKDFANILQCPKQLPTKNYFKMSIVSRLSETDLVIEKAKDDVLQKRILETYIILVTIVTPINLNE